LSTLSTYLHQPISKYDLAERSFHIARHLLGKYVGKQDEYAAAFGGLNFITFHPDGSALVEPIDLNPAVLAELQRNLMLFFTGSAHHSWSILQEQESSTRNQTGGALEALHEVKALGIRMRSALQQGDLREIGTLLHEGWQAKRRISTKISTPHIDELYTLAREHGALGGKITGAGGGGFLLLYCEPDRQPDVREAMRLHGIQEMTFGFDMQGAQAIVNDPFINRDERRGCSWTFVPNVTGVPVA
jgi:D-glycero-alpha-D-manno-heptose-7-phosphate kinase